MHESAIQGNSIELNNTDYNSTTAFEHPDLGNVTENVTQRVVVEYGDYAAQHTVYPPVGLPSILSTRIIVEYADTSLLIGLQRPEVLNQTIAPRIIIEYADMSFQLSLQRPETLTQTMAPRIIIEYADYATTIAVSPYMGPPPYSNGTSRPSIVVTREPSGPQVPENQRVLVSANVTDAESGVRNATLEYTLDNSTDWSRAHATPMSLSTTLQPQNSLALSFNATIQGQSSGTRVRFRIVAYDFAGNNATIDGVIDTTTYLVVPEFPSVVLLPLFVMASLCAAIVYRRRHSVSG
jgi:hypothetical protein